MTLTVNPAQLRDYVGKEVGLSDWLEVDQQRINQFADATCDHQYIHVEPARAAATPFGTTIAHGFLTLSLLSHFSASGGGIALANAAMGINYGLDTVRFVSPVKVGQRIRGRFVLMSCEEKKPKHFLMKQRVTVEIDGQDKPALIAEWLSMTVTA